MDDKEGNLAGRVAVLEASTNQIMTQLSRIEGLIREEVQQLKNENIKEIKDDLRQMRTDISALQRNDSRRVGGGNMLSGVGHFASAIIGGTIAAITSIFLHGK